MKTSTDSKRYSAIPLFLGGAAVLIFVYAVAATEPGKSIGLDIFLGAAVDVYVLGLWIYLSKIYWDKWKLWPKIGVVLFAGLIVCNSVMGVIGDWTRLPWIKAEAFTTVDEFLTDLKGENYASAMTRFTPRMRQCVNSDDFSQSNAQLRSWELSEMDQFSNILGMATFSDDQDLPLTVRMVWSDGQWQINGFWFGRWPETRLDYSSMQHCGE